MRFKMDNALRPNSSRTLAWGAAIACLMLLPCGAAQAEELSEQQFQTRLERAATLLANGEYEYSLSEFIALSKMDRHETPNYEPFFYIAKANFYLGELSAAQDSLNQFKCMLRVDSGVKKCSNAPNLKTSTPNKIVMYQSDFTDLQQCYVTMCGELYFSYYEDPTKRSLLSITKYWSEVDKLQEQMTASTSSTTPTQPKE